MSDTPTRSIIVEDKLPFALEKVWKALTTRDLIEAWLMPNTFEPEVGKKFVFKTKPRGDWDGTVHCELVAFEPCRLLIYTWRGAADGHFVKGSGLDTTVTWQLTRDGDGTLLRMEHSGFVSPQDDFAHSAMAPGWASVIARVGSVVERLVDA